MTTKLEKMADEWVTRNMSWDDYESDWTGSGEKTFIEGAEVFRRLVLEHLVSPVSDCYLEQRESLSRQEVIDLLEGISDKIKELGNENG